MEFGAVLDLCWSIRFLFLIREDPEPASYSVRGSDSVGVFREFPTRITLALSVQDP